jgi:hypothetical protein
LYTPEAGKISNIKNSDNIEILRFFSVLFIVILTSKLAEQNFCLHFTKGLGKFT